MRVYREADFLDPRENISIQKCHAVTDEPPHTHEFVEMVYICDGSATQYIGENAYEVGRGDLLFIDVGQPHAFCHIRSLSYLQILFAKTLRAMCREPVGGVELPFSALMAYIEDNLSQKLTPSDLAARCFYSPSYFCRVFKACYGLPPSSYIRKKRIEKAAQYLCETDYSVEKVIELVGYPDRKLFFKHFKEQTGKTPKAFRTEAQK